MARLVGEHKFQARKGFIYVEEYATKWEVVAKGYCAEFPYAAERYTKKECKTSQEAAQRLADKLNW